MGVRTAERMTGVSMVSLLGSDALHYTAMRGSLRGSGPISGKRTRKPSAVSTYPRRIRELMRLSRSLISYAG